MVFLFNGKYTLFYQNWPFGAAHGLKEWVHNESDDLVHFHVTGAELLPDTNEIATALIPVLHMK